VAIGRRHPVIVLEWLELFLPQIPSIHRFLCFSPRAFPVPALPLAADVFVFVFVVLVEPALTPVSVVAMLLLCPRARMESFDDDDEDDAAVCNNCDLSRRWAECVNGEDSEDASRLARASSRGPWGGSR
jgi:hypothetical protein